MFSRLNHLLRIFGGRCIIVDEGVSYVVLPLKEYLVLRERKGNDPRSGEDENPEESFDPGEKSGEDLAALETINSELALLKKDENEHTAAPTPPEVAREAHEGKSDYHIEDIPF